MINVEGILDQFNIIHSRANSRGWVELDCPYCGKPHLGWSVKSGVFNCFHCGKHPFIETLCSVLSISEESARLLVKQGGGRGRIAEAQEAGQVHAYVCKLPRVGVVPLRKGHRLYLEGRGFDVEALVETWKLESTPPGCDELSNRIYIPMHYNEKLVSWQLRSTRKDCSPKDRYRTASKPEEVMHHKDLVYGWDYVKPIKRAVVVEGPADVWKLGPGAVHTFGTAFTDAQVLILSQVEVLYTLFDMEPTAQKQAKDLAHRLSMLSSITKVANVVDIGFKDPGEMPLKEARRLMRKLGFPY